MTTELYARRDAERFRRELMGDPAVLTVPEGRSSKAGVSTPDAGGGGRMTPDTFRAVTDPMPRVGGDILDPPFRGVREPQPATLNVHDPFGDDRWFRPGLDGTGTEPDAIPFTPFSGIEDRDMLFALEDGATVAQVALELGRPQHHIDHRLHQILDVAAVAVPEGRFSQAGVSTPDHAPTGGDG